MSLRKRCRKKNWRKNKEIIQIKKQISKIKENLEKKEKISPKK